MIQYAKDTSTIPISESYSPHKLLCLQPELFVLDLFFQIVSIYRCTVKFSCCQENQTDHAAHSHCVHVSSHVTATSRVCKAEGEEEDQDEDDDEEEPEETKVFMDI